MSRERMMSTMNEFANTLIVAFLFQNVVFARGFGTGRILKVSENDSLIVPYSIIITSTTLFSSLVGYIISFFDIPIVVRQILEPLIFVIAMCCVYFCARLILATTKATWARKFAAMLSPAMINTTVLGTVLIAYRGMYTLPQYIGISIGTGLGFAVAAYIIHSGMKKIQDMQIIRSFSGLPIKLIYIGIIAVGIYGFIGKSILL